MLFGCFVFLDVFFFFQQKAGFGVLFRSRGCEDVFRGRVSMEDVFLFPRMSFDMRGAGGGLWAACGSYTHCELPANRGGEVWGGGGTL